MAVNYVQGEEQADAVVEEIGRAGSRSTAIRADVSREDQVLDMFQRMFQEFGTIDILVNNAGLQQDAPFEEMTLEQWKLVIGEPEDIGRASVWLASDQADYVNGTSLFVDGGMTMHPGFTEGG